MDKAAIIAQSYQFQPTDEQLIFCRQMADFLSGDLDNSCFILRGYAGTGKTTSVAALVKALPAFKFRASLLAPTGRAAKVMTSYSGRTALTIHKKIYRKRSAVAMEMAFQLAPNLAERTLFIIDEASMIADEWNTQNGSSFLKDVMEFIYNGKNCGVMFVGDTAQLPPVGSLDSPALHKSYVEQNFGLKVMETELREVVRQGSKSGILANASMLRKLINAHLEKIQESSGEEKMALPVFITKGYQDIFRMTGLKLVEGLEYAYHKFDIENSLVVCRSNKSANVYNQQIRARLLYREEELTGGDQIMVVRNNYFWLPDSESTSFIANGDMARIVRVRNEEERYGFRFSEVQLEFLDYPDAGQVTCKVMLDTLQGEKDVVDGINTHLEQIENYKLEADQAERAGDYGKVAEIRYGKIKEAQDKVEQLKVTLESQQGEGRMLKEEVTADDIAGVVARWTGIPVTKLVSSEREKLLHLEDELHKRVAGQDEAIEAISDAIRRSRAGLQDKRKPIGSFIFLGTTGVGKTELAKALAEFLFNDENALTRIDMSEYQERHAVSRLIGAPPGYVGYDEGGQLTEAVRRKPYSVVLLDEIEKAHPDVFNILLQVLDDGRLTDNKGRLVNFKNTIIIMTSNIGSHLIQDNFKELDDNNRDEVIAKTKNELFELLKQTIRPEFLNRIDELIMFTPLNRSEVRNIAALQFKHVQDTLAEMGIKIEASVEALDWIAELGYDPQFGARPLKRVIQKRILNELSKEILAGNISKDSKIKLDMFDKHFVFVNAAQEELEA